MIPPEHPGVALAKELESRGWSQSDLTFVLGCNPKAVNQIVNGKQGVSPAMSKALGQALHMPVEHFAELQRAFELSSATDPDSGVAVRAKLQSSYPIREMMKRGWLKEANASGLEQQIASFFEVSDIASVPYLAHAAKKTNYEEQDIAPAQLAWLFRVRQIAKSIAVPSYSRAALQSALPRLRDLLIAPEEARKAPGMIAECGVRLVIVEALPQSKIDGVCFWLDRHSPVIGLSLRFDRIDNFWFVLRHEIEHVLREDGLGSMEGVIDSDVQGGAKADLPPEELAANAAAADFCVPHEKMRSFILRKNPFFYEKDVLAFSKINGVHPGLAVGQIQHQTGRYDYLRKHQVKIRPCVLPGAIVDGWDQPLDLT